MSHLHSSVSGALRFFAFYLVNRTVELDVTEGIDYGCIFKEASAMEQVFAVFVNCLEVDAEGRVTVESNSRATHRAAQCARSWADPKYKVQPPFEPYETALYM
jgi:hypothetical protein